jgi:hypothetical protein
MSSSDEYGPACPLTLTWLQKHQPEDAAIIERLAEAKVFFYDGDGVIMPSQVCLSGAEIRNMIAEAGYNPLTRSQKDAIDFTHVRDSKGNTACSGKYEQD